MQVKLNCAVNICAFSKFLGLVLVIGTSLADLAEAQGVPESSQTIIRIDNPPIIVPEQVESAIARLANPELVVISPGESLVSSQQSFCPGSSVNYRQFLESMGPEFTAQLTGRQIDAFAVVDVPTLAFAPACIGRQFGVVEVRENERVWDIYRSLPTSGGIRHSMTGASFSAESSYQILQ